MEEDIADANPLQVNPGYAAFQLSKAFTTSQQHDDPATRERAEQKISKWMQVFNGLLNRTLNVGSRTPLKGLPGWATLEVVTGGFATGKALAGGPLQEYERVVLHAISKESANIGRRSLNAFYLSDSGLADLRERLASGCYDVTVPEEGALLVVAWLVDHGHADEARELLDSLAPWFPTLRFYPVPLVHPRQFGTRVFLQDVGTTIASLRQIKPNQQILAQKEAIEVWAPLYDRTVELFLQTVKGERPTLRCGSNGKWIRLPNGQFPVEGGWPCQSYPEGWVDRANQVLNAYGNRRKRYTLCGKPDRASDGFAQLRNYLRLAVENPASLTGRDVGRIRLLLARYVSKRGTPDSMHCKKIREQQANEVHGPTFHEMAGAVARRLDTYPKDAPLDGMDSVRQLLANDEPAEIGIRDVTSLPPSIQKKIERCVCETVEVLVERGIITSGETLARVLPQMTSGLRAAGISDTVLRQLYAAIYRAFRRRRSLLLLNLEKQIQLEELPWIAAIERFRTDSLTTQELAKQVLREVTTLSFVSFPYAILPNKLLQELNAIVKSAALDLPLVEEVAADIFMGEFSNKYVRAAKRAANLLEGSLYARYYGIDDERVRHLPEVERPKRSFFQRATTIDPFVQLCESRAGVAYGTGRSAINGMIIEQQQILTTQNLAVLFDGLGLA